jgi:catechol 2,3-dioxygenase-like lactoylglutathione lyase family enzyme
VTDLSLAMVTLVVPDYDEAIAHYTGALGFELVEDTEISAEKRWVVVAPGGGAKLLLAKASSPEQAAIVGNQTGGRVGLFLETSDFDSTYASYAASGVDFLETPRTEPYGRVAVFADLYGNKWDLIEPATGRAS